MTAASAEPFWSAAADPRSTDALRVRFMAEAGREGRGERGATWLCAFLAASSASISVRRRR